MNWLRLGVPQTVTGPGGAPAPWVELSEVQQALIERGQTPAAMQAQARCGC
jgi:hypothetical protein